MPAPIDSEKIIAKLLEKTEAGRIAWEGFGSGGKSFRCSLEDKYKFEITRNDDIYTIAMKDEYWNEIFVESIQEELIYPRAGDKAKFEMLQDLYEFARRSALDVEKKVADVSHLLDSV